jgi:FemAB-related protein (PEP-CTERM system-associated)
MNVHTLLPEDRATGAGWDAFVRGHAEGTFFHLSGWQRVLQHAFGHRTAYLYTTVDDAPGGAVSGVLPLVDVRSWLFGSFWSSLAFGVYGGVVASTESAGAALVAEADRRARVSGAQHLELRHTRTVHPDWPAQDLYVTFRKAIEPEEEANLLAIPRKQRAMVRKGIKNGLVSHIDTAPDGPGVARFFALYADNVHRHGTPALPRRYFEALRAEFGDAVEVLTVTDAAGTPVSSVLSFYFRDEVLPYYAGDAVAARELAANDFKYWELMRRACARGLKTFDYGRSKRGTGSFDFKKNWGFEPTPLRYEYRLYKRDSVPQNNPNNPKYRLLIAAWRRLPIGVANWLGPFLVKSLG